MLPKPIHRVYRYNDHSESGRTCPGINRCRRQPFCVVNIEGADGLRWQDELAVIRIPPLNHRPAREFPVLIISVRLFTSSNTEYVPIDPAVRAQQLAIISLDRCISIFREIGEILKNDRMPGESLRCDESAATNLVIRADGDIKISHPQPDFMAIGKYMSARTILNPPWCSKSGSVPVCVNSVSLA